MTAQREHFAQGVGFVLLATLGWSLSGLFVRFMPDLNGWQINCWRGYWMAAALACYLVWTYGSDLPALIRAIPASAFWSSALCFAVGTTFYVSSLTLTSTATVSVIGATSPLVTGLLSPWITGERPGVIRWIAALIALSGALVIGWSGFESGQIFGIILSFGVPITFAIQTLLLRRYRHLDMMPAIGFGGFLAFLGAGFAPLIGNLFGLTAVPMPSGFSVTLRDMFLLFLMGPIQLSIPLVFYARGARNVAAVTLAILSMLDAILNPLWPWLFVNEVPGRASIIGGSIILGAVALGVLGGHAYGYARRMSTR